MLKENDEEVGYSIFFDDEVAVDWRLNNQHFRIKSGLHCGLLWGKGSREINLINTSLETPGALAHRLQHLRPRSFNC